MIEVLPNIKLNDLPIYNDKYIKLKAKTFGDKVYATFCGLNVLEDRVKCESFTSIYIDSFLN